MHVSPVKGRHGQKSEAGGSGHMGAGGPPIRGHTGRAVASLKQGDWRVAVILSFPPAPIHMRPLQNGLHTRMAHSDENTEFGPFGIIPQVHKYATANRKGDFEMRRD